MKIRFISYYFFLLLVFKQFAFSQPVHQRTGVTVESILAQKSPNRFRAMENSEKYLVIEQTKTIKRKKVHLEDELYFSRQDNVYFEGVLKNLSDSTLSIAYLDQTSSRYEIRLFYLNEVRRIYKRPKRNKIRVGLHAATLAPLLYDWIWWRETPIDDPSTLYGIAALAGLNTIIANSEKFFRSQKIGKRNRLRVFQYY